MRSHAMRKATRRYIWDRIKVSLWFAPLVMAVAAILLSWLLGRLDEQIPNRVLHNSKLLLSGSPSELRTIMLGVASTVLGTAGVVFSLLTLPLGTVASQFGSRLLRIFMRDRTTQFVLGMFVATFCYCLATAIAIPVAEIQYEVPQITVTIGLLLMLLTFASLIILIQHISIMLQAPNIVAAAGADLREVVKAHDSIDTKINLDVIRAAVREIRSLPESEAYPLRAGKTGYIQFVDPEIILDLAQERNVNLRLLHKPGHFVMDGEVIALIWPADRVDVRMARHFRRAVQIGNQRTPTQDIGYGINQLTEIAMRAMSPAINDPFTAITCLDHLSDGLARFIRSRVMSPDYYDKDGQLRLVFEPLTFRELLDAAFDMLRHASCDNATVLLHLLDTLETIGRVTDTPEVRREILRHVQLALAECQTGALIESDRQRILKRGELVEASLVRAA